MSGRNVYGQLGVATIALGLTTRHFRGKLGFIGAYLKEEGKSSPRLGPCPG